MSRTGRLRPDTSMVSRAEGPRETQLSRTGRLRPDTSMVSRAEGPRETQLSRTGRLRPDTSMETAIDFKSLRAKFQEEVQSKERPTVTYKPKRTPLPVGGSTSPVLRDERKLAPGKRPVPVPTTFFHHGNDAGGGVGRLSLKDRQFPLVLPASSNPEPKLDPLTSSAKLVTSPIKCGKKAMPTPFRPTKFSRCIKDILEGAGEHAENGLRPRSAESSPGGERVANGFSRHSDEPNSESSPEPPATPAADSSSSVGHVLSTLEKAKKKFSPKNLLVYARPKSFYASKSPSGSPPSSVDYENIQCEAGVRRPAASSACTSSPSQQAAGFTHNLARIPETNPANAVDPESPAVPPPPEFEAPEFPDFEASVLEALNSNLINLASLELEATDFGATLPPPILEDGHDVHLQDPGRCDEVVQRHLMYLPEVPQERSAASENWTDSWSGTSLEPELSRELISEIPKSDVTLETSANGPQSILPVSMSCELPSEPSRSQKRDHSESCDNVYEEVETVTKVQLRENSRKRKGPPKNPYAETPVKEERCRIIRNVSLRKERSSPDHHEDKELRKREKQRLEREKKEQKEREKKESLMRKKFKVTGQEEPMYHARVLVTSKLRKHDLQVNSGDTVSIIRTTNCPKGKWLARDAQHTYGYISVMNVELNMKEMLELGKRASQAAGRGTGELDTLSLSSRSSHYNLALTSSFTDDSEEWSGEEESSSILAENTNVLVPNRAVSMPDVSGGNASAVHVLSAGSLEDIPSQETHVALRKLAVFFQNSKEDVHSVTEHTDSADSNLTGPGLLSAVEEPHYVEEDPFSFTDMELLPPPDLYADPI